MNRSRQIAESNYTIRSRGRGFGQGVSSSVYALYAAAVAVYDFRKMVKSYSGNCITMSDGVTDADIGWFPEDENGVEWVNTFDLFDAIAQGYTGVKTLYDQKDNADLTQRTFSLVTNPITVDISATPTGTPALRFGAPTAGQNALHDNANAGALSNIFDTGGTIAMAGAFDASATSASYICSKGSANYIKYHNTSVTRFGQDFATTDAVFHKSGFPNTANTWWNALIAYDKSNVANIPSWQLDNDVLAQGSVTTTPVGAASSDTSNKFSLGNRATGSAGSMSGYISSFAMWDNIL